MRTEAQIVDRLHEMAEQFIEACRMKRWITAKHLYDKAICICVEMQLPESIQIDLFGSRPYEDEPENATKGRFDEDLVIKMMENLIKSKEEELEECRNRKIYMENRRIYTKK